MIGARETCKAMLRPGTAVADLYRAYVEYLRERGIEPTLKFLGHGIGQTIRNHYVLAYRPSHGLEDGQWHKIKVTVVNPAGSAPGSKEDIGRKYQVIAREGYRATPR